MGNRGDNVQHLSLQHPPHSCRCFEGESSFSCLASPLSSCHMYHEGGWKDSMSASYHRVWFSCDRFFGGCASVGTASGGWRWSREPPRACISSGWIDSHHENNSQWRWLHWPLDAAKAGNSFIKNKRTKNHGDSTWSCWLSDAFCAAAHLDAAGHITCRFVNHSDQLCSLHCRIRNMGRGGGASKNTQRFWFVRQTMSPPTDDHGLLSSSPNNDLLPTHLVLSFHAPRPIGARS